MVKRNLPLFSILIVTILTYWSVTGFEYINYDDGAFVGVANSQIPWWDFFVRFHLSDYIPLTFLSFRWEALAFGMHPAVSHGLNLLLHLVNIGLFWRLAVWLLEESKLAALCATLFFALHPMNVEAVAWVTERKGLLCMFFVLLALLSYLRRLQLREEQPGLSRKWFWLTYLFFVLALLSKPSAIFLPMAFGVLDYWVWRHGERRKWFLEKVPMFLVSMVFFVVAGAARNSEKVLSLEGVDWWGYFSVIARALAMYFSKIFYPEKLSAFYTEESLHISLAGLALVLVVLSFLGLWCWKRPDFRRPLAGSWVLFFVFLLPHLKVVPYGLLFYAADRYFYFASIGAGLFVGTLVRAFEEQRQRRLAWAVAAFLLVFAGPTYQRIQIWRDSGTFWTSVIERDPSNSLAQNNLGLFYLDRGLEEKGYNAFVKSIEADPTYAPPWVNIASILAQKGDFARAESALRQALFRNPNLREAQEGLVRIQEELRLRQPKPETNVESKDESSKKSR